MSKQDEIENNIIQFWIQHLKEVEHYINIMNATDEERLAVYEWVEEMNACETNPYKLCNEHGKPLDYISAYRMHNN